MARSRRRIPPQISDDGDDGIDGRPVVGGGGDGLQRRAAERRRHRVGEVEVHRIDPEPVDVAVADLGRVERDAGDLVGHRPAVPGRSLGLDIPAEVGDVAANGAVEHRDKRLVEVAELYVDHVLLTRDLWRRL